MKRKWISHMSAQDEGLVFLAVLARITIAKEMLNLYRPRHTRVDRDLFDSYTTELERLEELKAELLT